MDNKLDYILSGYIFRYWYWRYEFWMKNIHCRSYSFAGKYHFQAIKIYAYLDITRIEITKYTSKQWVYFIFFENEMSKRYHLPFLSLFYFFPFNGKRGSFCIMSINRFFNLSFFFFLSFFPPYDYANTLLES